MLLFWIFVVILVFCVIYALQPPRAKQLIEGLENADTGNGTDESTSSCDTSLISFKNAGSIQALQDTVNKLADQVSLLQTTQSANSASIQQLQTQATKFGDLAEQAEELATQNKERLMQLAQESQQKYNNAKASLSSIPDIQGSNSTASSSP